MSEAIIDKILDTDEEFAHYGVKGMKWGVRKTVDRVKKSASDFKERNDAALETRRRNKAEPTSEDHNLSRENMARKTSSLSNAELRKLNERLQLEQSYSDLKRKRVANGGFNADKTLKQIDKTLKLAVEVDKATGGLGSQKIQDAILERQRTSNR